MKISHASSKTAFGAMALFTAATASAAFVTPPLAPPAVNGPNESGPVKVADPVADRTSSCDAACLQGVARGYLTALSRRDYSTLQVAPNLIVVENGQATRIGDNLWRVLEKLDLNATYFADAVQGQVIALTTVEESAHQPFILVVRLKIEDRKIAEVESMLTADIDAGQHFRPDNIANFDPTALAVLPAADRMTRAELQTAEDAWWYEAGAGLTAAADCHRAENADSPKEISKCGVGQRRSAGSPSYAFRAIRQPVIDVERGLVVTYLLTDTTPYLNPNPPDAERTPLFYRQPLTTIKVTVHKFSKGGVLRVDHNFMNYQAPGLRAYFPR
jgi:hypothetical protein